MNSYSPSIFDEPIDTTFAVFLWRALCLKLELLWNGYESCSCFCLNCCINLYISCRRWILCTRSSSEFQWLELNIGYQNSSLSNDRQGSMALWCIFFVAISQDYTLAQSKLHCNFTVLLTQNALNKLWSSENYILKSDNKIAHTTSNLVLVKKLNQIWLT